MIEFVFKLIGGVIALCLRLVLYVLRKIFKVLGDLIKGLILVTKGWILLPFWIIVTGWVIRILPNYPPYGALATFVFVMFGIWWWSRKFRRSYNLRRQNLMLRDWMRRQDKMNREMHERIVGGGNAVGRRARRVGRRVRSLGELPSIDVPDDAPPEVSTVPTDYHAGDVNADGVVDMGDVDAMLSKIKRDAETHVRAVTDPRRLMRRRNEMKAPPTAPTATEPSGSEPTPEEIGRAVAAAMREYRR
jgi:hypothetical protein